MVALVPGEDTPQPNEHPSDPNDIFALCSNPHPFDPNFTAGEHAPVVTGGTPTPPPSPAMAFVSDLKTQRFKTLMAVCIVCGRNGASSNHPIGDADAAGEPYDVGE